jgi:hypothetical protein
MKNKPKDRKMYQIAIKYITIFTPRPSKIFQSWDFVMKIFQLTTAHKNQRVLGHFDFAFQTHFALTYAQNFFLQFSDKSSFATHR